MDGNWNRNYNADLDNDVFHKPDEGPAPSSPSTPAVNLMPGLEHILHSRSVRPPSQRRRSPSGSRSSRPSSGGRSRPHRDDRDRPPRDQDLSDGPPRYYDRYPRDDRPRYPENDRYPRDDRPRYPENDRYPRDDRPRYPENDRYPRDDRPTHPDDDRYPRDKRPRYSDDDRYPRDNRPRYPDDDRNPSRPRYPEDDRYPRNDRPKYPDRDRYPNDRPKYPEEDRYGKPRDRERTPPPRYNDRYPNQREWSPRDLDREPPIRAPRDDRAPSTRSYEPRDEKPWPPAPQEDHIWPSEDGKLQAVELNVRDDKSTDVLTQKDVLNKESKVPRDEDIDGGEKRETWGHKAEFILATVGLAVGLGNVWRFPYLCQKNGGGAFLIPYFIFMLIEGLPLFFLELSIGQRMRKSAISCWRDIHPCLFGIGVACLMVSLMLCLYYVVVIAWCCYYFFISFTSSLPWKKETLCHNWGAYSTVLNALKTYENSANFTKNSTLHRALQFNETSFPDCCVRDAPQYYFYHHALQISTDIEDLGGGINGKLVGCLIFAWIVTYLCVVKGIKSSGKVVYFTATFPYIILIILFFRGVTLEGAGNGIKTFFTPDWKLLLNANIWKDAATQMFFTLSLGFGALIAFASYMPIHNQVMRDAYTVVLINCGTSIFAGIVVFSILGYRETVTGISATEVGSGPGLAFMTFSDAMLLMDVSPLWAILFFTMLILLGIDSEFGTLEAAIGPIMELNLFPKVRKELVTLGVAVILFLLGLCMVSGPGFYIFQMFDDYSVTIPLLIIALFQCIGVAWVYGNDRFADDIEFMTGKRPWVGWMICWKYISPLALFVVLIALIVQQSEGPPQYSKFVGCTQKPYGDSKGSKSWTEKVPYPGWGIFVVVCIVLASTLPVLIWLIKDWPKNWRQGFHKMLCTGTNNYLPDPKKEESEKQQPRV